MRVRISRRRLKDRRGPPMREEIGPTDRRHRAPRWNVQTEKGASAGGPFFHSRPPLSALRAAARGRGRAGAEHVVALVAHRDLELSDLLLGRVRRLVDVERATAKARSVLELGGLPVSRAVHVQDRPLDTRRRLLAQRCEHTRLDLVDRRPPAAAGGRCREGGQCYGKGRAEPQSSSSPCLTFSWIWSITEGSLSVVTSPSSRPSAMSRSSRRMILPDRVLGRSSAQMIRFGRANLPILSPTW